MDRQQIGLAHRSAPARRQLLNEVDRLLVVDHLQVLAQRLARDGDPLLQDDARLGIGQGRALDGVAVIGKVEVIEPLEVSRLVRRQGPQPVEFPPPPVQAGIE